MLCVVNLVMIAHASCGSTAFSSALSVAKSRGSPTIVHLLIPRGSTVLSSESL